MTTRIVKTATIGAVAVALVVVLLAYSAMASSAFAQTATSSSTSASQTMTRAGNSNNHPGPWAGQQQSNGSLLQRGGGGSWAGQQQTQVRGGGGSWAGQQQTQVSLSVGQTITVTSTQGEYRTVGSSSTNGTASGTVTFTVTGELTQGYTLSLSGGSLTVAGTTYSISSGSAQMNLGATTISGQGTTSPTGQFIVHATAHGTFAGSSGSVSLDLTNGTTEYLVILSGSVQG